MLNFNGRATSPKTQSPKDNKVLFRAYKMTHFDSPFVCDGVLSVATCLGSLRQNWQVGEWICAFSSIELKTIKGQEKLIYIAKVSEKLSLKEYWQQYPKRRPDKVDGGDNLYKFVLSEYVSIDKYGKQHKIHPSNKKDIWHRKNIKADCVLVSHEFYYFGERYMQTLPMRSSIRVSRSGSKNCDKQIFENTLKFVRTNKDKCAKFKDEKGNVGGKDITYQSGAVSQGGGSCGSANQSGSCGGTSKGAC